jgi:hypothetical protein
MVSEGRLFVARLLLARLSRADQLSLRDRSMI